MSAQRTPTPWETEKPEDSNGYVYVRGVDGEEAAVCYAAPKSDGNAAFIVRACNAHDALVSALSDLEAIFDGQEDCDDGVPNDAMRAMTIIRAALAKAGAA